MYPNSYLSKGRKIAPYIVEEVLLINSVAAKISMQSEANQLCQKLFGSSLALTRTRKGGGRPKVIPWWSLTNFFFHLASKPVNLCTIPCGLLGQLQQFSQNLSIKGQNKLEKHPYMYLYNINIILKQYYGAALKTVHN